MSKFVWLRVMTPWWFLRWIDRHFGVCWAGIVMWKLGYPWDWRDDGSCAAEEWGCMCGRFPEEED